MPPIVPRLHRNRKTPTPAANTVAPRTAPRAGKTPATEAVLESLLFGTELPPPEQDPMERETQTRWVDVEVELSDPEDEDEDEDEPQQSAMESIDAGPDFFIDTGADEPMDGSVGFSIDTEGTLNVDPFANQSTDGPVGFSIDTAGTLNIDPFADNADSASLDVMDIPKQKRKVTVAVPVLEYVDPDESDSADRTDWLNTAQTEGPAAAWQDEDDEVEVVGINRRLDRHVRQTAEETHLDGVELQRRLRTKFEQINPTPDWAQTEPQAPARAQAKKVKKAKGSDSDEDTDTEDDPDAIFRSTQPLLAGSGSRLAVQPSKYSPKRRAEVARFTATEGRLQSIAFHPTAHILMTTTSKGTLQLYDIDGRRNVLIQNIKFPGDRLQEAHFTPAGDEIIAIANRRTYYSYHIPTGQILTCKNHFADNDRNFASVRISPDNRFMGYAARGGHIGLVSPKSRTLVHRLKMDHTPTDLQWSHDSNYLYALDPAARCLVWDVRMLRTVHTFHDQGGFKPTTLALSPDRNHYSVIGSETGLVNIYDHQLVKHTARPTPLKTIDNLTTPISHLQFNSDGQFLLINSETAEMGLRLFHMPTRSVLARWPMITGDTQRVNHAAFAHDSRYLAMHDDSRSVVLYEMPGY